MAFNLHDQYERRAYCLELAIQSYGPNVASGNDIRERAAVFADFIRSTHDVEIVSAARQLAAKVNDAA